MFHVKQNGGNGNLPYDTQAHLLDAEPLRCRIKFVLQGKRRRTVFHVKQF